MILGKVVPKLLAVAGAFTIALLAAMREVPLPERVSPASWWAAGAGILSLINLAVHIQKWRQDPADAVATMAKANLASVAAHANEEVEAVEQRLVVKFDNLTANLADKLNRGADERKANMARLARAEEDIHEIELRAVVVEAQYTTMRDRFDSLAIKIDSWRERDEEKYLNVMSALVALGGDKDGRQRRRDDSSR